MKRVLVGTLALLIGLTWLSLAALTPAAAQDKDKAKDKDKKEAPVVEPRKGELETIKLFNGKDLDGWEGYEDYWSVKDGEIVGKNKDEVKVSTYLLTKKKFTDFRLTANVKLVESEMHSGICFWGRVGPEVVNPEDLRKEKVKYTYAGHLVMFPSGWGMFDLFGGPKGTGVGIPVDAAPAKKVGKQHDWNELEILAQGNRVRVAVNGTQVIDWREPNPDRIKEAPIGLQLHSNKVPQEVRFKDLTVTTFPKEDKLITVK
jgi:hypothetical protein